MEQIMAVIIGMVHYQKSHQFFLDASKVLNLEELQEMQSTLLCDFNIKSAKILDNVYLYYLGTFTEDVEKALITSAKIQYYVDYCQG